MLPSYSLSVVCHLAITWRLGGHANNAIIAQALAGYTAQERPCFGDFGAVWGRRVLLAAQDGDANTGNATFLEKSRQKLLGVDMTGGCAGWRLPLVEVVFDFVGGVALGEELPVGAADG